MKQFSPFAVRSETLLVFLKTSDFEEVLPYQRTEWLLFFFQYYDVLDSYYVVQAFR